MSKPIIALACAAALLLGACSSGPEDTVKDFYNALNEGEVSKAFALVDMRSPKLAMMGQEKLKAALTETSKRLSAEGMKDLKVTCEAKAEFASCESSFKTTKGESRTSTDALVKNENGKWVIAVQRN